MAVIGMASAHAQAAQVRVKPVGVATCNLSRDNFGNPLDPFGKTGNEIIQLQGVALISGTEAVLMLQLPEGTTAQGGLPGDSVPGFRLASFADSTGKDLLKIPEGAGIPNQTFPNLKPVMVKAAPDSNRFLVVAHGLLCPAPGATLVRGELQIDTFAGKPIETKSPATFLAINEKGTITDGKLALVSWQVLPNDHFPDGYGPRSQNPKGPKASVTFARFDSSVIAVAILDAKGTVLMSSPARPEAMTVAFPPGQTPYYISLSHAAQNAAQNTITVPFEIGLGVAAQ